MKLQCTDCKKLKDSSEFMLRPKTIRGFNFNCRKCSNKKQRERRAKNSDKVTKKYEKTLKGKLMRTYRNMSSRVKGILKKKSHLYEGLPIVDRESFYEWSLNNEDYIRIFKNWEDSGYELKESPSIDRKDANKGYTLDNMRWVTFSFNCSNVDRS